MSIFGSMKTAVSGMNAQANRLSTSADNIANVNTTGYKSASVAFSSLILPASRGSYNSGGVESTIRYAISQEGAYTTTTSATDMSIKGDGFFIVQGADGRTLLTRAGNFLPDADGNLVNAAGYQLMGYSFDSGAPSVVVNGFDGLEPVNVKTQGLTVVPSSAGSFSGNLNEATTVADPTELPSNNVAPADGTSYSTSIVGYDTLGATVQYDYHYTKTAETATGSTWEVAVYRHDGAAGSGSNFPYSSAALATGTMEFDTNGALTSGGTITPDNTFDVTDATAGTVIQMDMSKFTQYSSASAATGKINGQQASEIVNVTIDKDGVVFANFVKGDPRAIYRIPLATVASPDLLTPEAGNVFAANGESGVTVSGFPETNGMGYIQTNSVEGSNVDLAEQLTDMIESQRSYTANSKVFQTGADLMDVLVNLKR